MITHHWIPPPPFHRFPQRRKKVVRRTGFEPATACLENRDSTVELPTQKFKRLTGETYSVCYLSTGPTRNGQMGISSISFSYRSLYRRILFCQHLIFLFKRNDLVKLAINSDGFLFFDLPFKLHLANLFLGRDGGFVVFFLSIVLLHLAFIVKFPIRIGHDHSLFNLLFNCVIFYLLEGGNCHGGQEADNDNDDHKFNKGKARFLFHRFLHK